MIDQAPQAAREAGLRYVSDDGPGIRRRRHSGGFSYAAADGTPITDDAELARIKSLAVPPAYERVWICPFANGHLQATGLDARGRKQYRYHPRWRETRDATKFDRMLGFASALPHIRAAVERDLALPGLPREKVLAAVARLLEETSIRIGNERYAKENDSYGLTTMRARHARIAGTTIRFQFKGKSGVKHAVELRDRALAKLVRACLDLPGQDLFQYIDEEGIARGISSHDVNAYIQSIGGSDFTAKDFRTWVGTVQCALLLAGRAGGDSHTERKRELNEVIAAVAERLGNTPAVCRKSYIHPEIMARYADGTLGAMRHRKAAKGLTPEELFVVSELRRGSRKQRLPKRSKTTGAPKGDRDRSRTTTRSSSSPVTR